MAIILTPTWSDLVPTAHPFELSDVRAAIRDLVAYEEHMGHNMFEIHVPNSMPRLGVTPHWHPVPGTGIGGSNAYVLCYEPSDDTPPENIIR